MSAIKIFISHKDEYSTEAIDLREKLYYLGAGRIDLSLSNEIPSGTDRRHWIVQMLGEEANILLLLFMNPTNQWDWCLYETGLFDGLNQGSLIVLHNADTEPPRTLSHFIAFKATPPEIKKFLKQLFGSTNFGIPEAINPPYAKNENLIERDAREICDLFTGARSLNSQFFTNKIIIRIQSKQDLASGTIPPSALIEADNITLQMFGLLEPTHNHWTWGNLLENLDDKSWVKVIDKAVCSASQGEYFDPFRPSFQLRNGKIFTPILYRFDEGVDGTDQFHVLFVEDITEGVVAYAPERLATLLSTLNLGSRFQWELCERYLAKLRKWNTNEETITVGCQAIRESLDNIEREAIIREQREFQGSQKRDRLVWAFDSLEDQQIVDDNLSKQEQFKAQLKTALKEKNLAKIEILLKNLQGLNMLLVSKISSRYDELIQVVPKYSDGDLEISD